METLTLTFEMQETLWNAETWLRTCALTSPNQYNIYMGPALTTSQSLTITKSSITVLRASMSRESVITCVRDFQSFQAAGRGGGFGLVRPKTYLSRKQTGIHSITQYAIRRAAPSPFIIYPSACTYQTSDANFAVNACMSVAILFIYIPEGAQMAVARYTAACRWKLFHRRNHPYIFQDTTPYLIIP